MSEILLEIVYCQFWHGLWNFKTCTVVKFIFCLFKWNLGYKHFKDKASFFFLLKYEFIWNVCCYCNNIIMFHESNCCSFLICLIWLIYFVIDIFLANYKLFLFLFNGIDYKWELMINFHFQNYKFVLFF